LLPGKDAFGSGHVPPAHPGVVLVEPRGRLLPEERAGWVRLDEELRPQDPDDRLGQRQGEKQRPGQESQVPARGSAARAHPLIITWACALTLVRPADTLRIPWRA